MTRPGKPSVGPLVRPFAAALERAIGAALPTLLRRSLRRDLHSVWGRSAGGELEPRVVLAANHHSWWDGYLAWLLLQRLGRPACGLMAAEQLEHFPFFRRLGMLAHTEVRAALRRLQAGEVLLLFPEGRLQPSGPLGELRPGLEFFADHADAVVRPLAIRVAMRGQQRPEALLDLGPALPSGPDLSGRYRCALEARLGAIDALLATTDPEAPPPGFERWLVGRASTDRRWRRLAGWGRS